VETKPIINIVATQCQPEVEEAFNRWYNDIHIPMLFKFKGIKKVTRYKRLSDAEELPTYIATYEFDNQKDYEAYTTSPELAAARDEMNETWKQEGFEVKWQAQYEPIKTWER